MSEGEDGLLYRVRGVRKVYGMGEIRVTALDGVDLAIPRGEVLVILGPSGSGKSTLLHLLGGMDRPTEGSVIALGRDLAQADPAELTRFRRDHVGFVFQFYNLVPSLTALENVEMATELSAHPRDAGQTLGLLGLKDRADHFPSQLSGGEQQRVAIARAVAKDPEVLLCDEPTGALDYQTGKLVLAALARVNRELGTTVVLITHNAAIGGMGDRTMRMRSGRIAEVRENPRRLTAEEVEW